MMKAKHCLLVLVLLLLSGCSQTVKNFIPPEQLTARSPEREQKASEFEDFEKIDISLIEFKSIKYANLL